jgi:bifunctional aspartokinase / homoserine dehydrogenase 1
MNVLKFGGTSLATKEALGNVLDIIKKAKQQSEIIVVFSAISDTTNRLLVILELAKENNTDYIEKFKELRKLHQDLYDKINLSQEFFELNKYLDGIFLLNDYSTKIRNIVLSFGEILSGKLLSAYLKDNGLDTEFLNSTQYLKTSSDYENPELIWSETQKNLEQFFQTFDLKKKIPVFTGFIASNLENDVTLLGRNGSNYTASIIANVLNAKELQIWTDVNGLYTADPNLVEESKIVPNISYSEANELANFGNRLIHAKSIAPAEEKNIPIIISNTFSNSTESTRISNDGNKEGIKAISSIEDLALITMQGKGMRGKIAIDARVFSSLSQSNISVRMVSQASSERSIGLIVDRDLGDKAKSVLEKEFNQDIINKDISQIHLNKNVSVVAIISKGYDHLWKVFNSLSRNNIQIHLIANSINHNNVSIVIDSNQLKKALDVIHGQILEMPIHINIAVFGKGNVGKTFLKQLESNKARLENEQNYRLNIFAEANSKELSFTNKDPEQNEILEKPTDSIADLIKYSQEKELDNLVFIDLTADDWISKQYERLLQNSFHIVAANKRANTDTINYYNAIKKISLIKNLYYLYETNVGASLPIIETIQQISISGDKIIEIKGVLSGSLSYICNQMTKKGLRFSEALESAITENFTEPNFIEDLRGLDVARKLLIMGREIGLQVELADIDLEPIIPEKYLNLSTDEFKKKYAELDDYFEKLIHQLKEKNLSFQYLAQLTSEGKLKVFPAQVANDSSLAILKHTDAIVEIYTERYGETPLVIQGSGAGRELTAGGVFSDLLKIAHYLKRY